MRRFSLVAVLVAVVAACGDDDKNDPLADAGPVAENYARNVHANYSEVLSRARSLRSAIDTFVATPSQQTMDAAKSAWVQARTPYGPSEVYRFYGGPIDDESNNGPEGFINAWPLDENFIDYTVDSPQAGLINNVAQFPTITKDAIRSANERESEKTISTGYHAIEFLLWGQDLDDPRANTAGRRLFTDYTVAANAQRRGQYLKLVAEMLVDDLEYLVQAWQPNSNNYAKNFVADPKEALTKMLTGIGSMANAELSGERMTVAYKNRGQEDEHSCFSDTTNADLLGNFKGIQNVYLGRYGSNDGPGLDDLVKKIDADLDARMQKELSDGVSALNAMQSVPFDLAIQGDNANARQNVLRAINVIKAVAVTTRLVGEKLGLTFQLEDPSPDGRL